MGVVEEWESGGGQGDVPPGMGEPGPERDSESEIVQAIKKHVSTRFGYSTIRGIDGPAR